MVKSLTYFIIPAIFIVKSFAQTNDIQQKESELSSVKTEINNLENELAAKSAVQKKTFETVEILSKQNFLLNKILADLRSEINIKDIEIQSIEKKIRRTETDIKMLQDNYARYVSAVYRKGQYNELESLLNAESVQQALMRTYYLQVFSEQREKDLEKFKIKKLELDEAKRILRQELKEKLHLAEQRDIEKKNLTKKLNEKRTALKSIEKNNNELKKIILAKKDSQKKIEQLITKLMEQTEKEEEKFASLEKSGNKTEKIKDENIGYEYDLSTGSFASFADLKGKMTWPLMNGKIIRRFGENKHKSLKTVTLNYGIDIKANKDKNVRSVGEGVVAAIDWLPGYGNVIIVSHKNNFRTVYGHVYEIFVSEGDKVKTGSVIALVDEGIDGFVLHFEIWKGRDKQNPEVWLAKK
jgi:septal ring factor EnvC (AmiA/AmiB activator)